MVSADVTWPRIISTSGISGTGFMKCIPTTLSGRLVAAPSSVIEMDEVFEARMTSGWTMTSTLPKIARLASASSTIASTTKSVSTRSSTEVAVVSRPSTPSRSPADSRPFSTNLARLLSIVCRARSSIGCAMSTNRTAKPACANVCAMPLPIVPAPMTPTVFIGTVEPPRSHEDTKTTLFFFRFPAFVARCLSEWPPSQQCSLVRFRLRVFVPSWRPTNSHALDGQGDAVAAAEAQRRDAASEVAALQRIEQRGEHAAAARSDGVAERDGAAVDVHLLLVDSKLVQDRDRLDRERFVELEEIDVGEIPARFFNDPADGFDRRHQHELRRQPAGRLRHDTRQRREPERFRADGVHDDERGRTVVDAGRIAGRHRAVCLERGPQRRERFNSGVGANRFVAIDDHRSAFLLRHARSEEQRLNSSHLGI